jgi:hypothetical protein
MTLVDQVEKMLKEHRGNMNIPADLLEQFEKLVAAGIIQRRVYDLRPVDVLGPGDRSTDAGANRGGGIHAVCDSRGGGIRLAR